MVFNLGEKNREKKHIDFRLSSTLIRNQGGSRLGVVRAVDSFWHVFDRLINKKFTSLNNVVLAGDFLAITNFDNWHERMETWREKANTTL